MKTPRFTDTHRYTKAWDRAPVVLRAHQRDVQLQRAQEEQRAEQDRLTRIVRHFHNTTRRRRYA